MWVRAQNVVHKFGRQYVVKDISFQLDSGTHTAIVGGNGSGKSTLLKLLLGALRPFSGKLEWGMNEEIISSEEAPFRLSFTGPYVELIEELTLSELIRYHSLFRPLQNGLKAKDCLEIIGLETAKDKRLSHFSSGMKQRVKLALCLLSQSEMVLLDEPISNLDRKGIEWYQNVLKDQLGNRTLVVGSNHIETEIFSCTDRIELG